MGSLKGDVKVCYLYKRKKNQKLKGDGLPNVTSSKSGLGCLFSFVRHLTGQRPLRITEKPLTGQDLSGKKKKKRLLFILFLFQTLPDL